MRKKHIKKVLLTGLLILGGGSLLIGCDTIPSVNPVDEEKLEFEQTLYEVSSGDKVTVKGNVEGVTYAFQGGTPEGVTLNATTGEITFDEYRDDLPESRYIATKGTLSAQTTIRFVTKEVLPTITFNNVSNYLLNGDAVSASASSETGRKYAISYSLKEEVEGIGIDATSGVVSYSADVKDGTSFVVVASSGGATLEHTFIAMTENIIGTSTTIQIVESGSKDSAVFVLDFNGNTEGDRETTSENLRLALNNTILDNTGYSYNATTKEITINSDLIATFGTGEVTLRALTQRNAVSLNLVVADKFIYTADDFYTIFEPNYSGETPTFKEGSLSGYYVLANDIDLTSYLSPTGLGYNQGKGWLPIGAYSDGVYDFPFTGTFNGNGHTISGYYLNDNRLFVAGLFGRNQGTIKNFTIKGTIDLIASWSGGVVGNNGDMGTIENVIADLNMPNEGQSATGVIASTNWGRIRNVFSLNSNVTGYDAGSFANAGIMVGLNETTGTITNAYGVSPTVNADNEHVYGIFGSSNNSEVTQENAGKLFTTLEELQNYDYSTLITDDIFNLAVGQTPSLNVEFVPLSAGYMRLIDVPQYVFVGDTIDMKVEILPSEYQTELENSVVYTVSGVEGVTVSGSTIDLTNATVTDGAGTLEITGTLDVKGKILTATGSVNVYDEVNSITITNTETVVDEGSVTKLTSVIDPNISTDDVVYSINEPTWMTRAYVSIEGDNLIIDENIFSGLDSVSVVASAYGITSAPVTFGVRHYENLVGSNNVIHYTGEESLTYDYTLPSIEGISIREVSVDGETLSEDSYTFEANVLKIAASAITGTDTMHEVKITNGWGGIYKGFATMVSHEEYDQDYVTTNYPDAIAISSLDDFKQYFALDGEMTSEHVANMSKTYYLTNDIDFGGETVVSIGNMFVSGAFSDETSVNFTGKIFGLGHTISNYKVSNVNGFGGLFRQIEGGVYDLNISEASVTNQNSLFTGAVAGIFGGEADIENVNVMNSTVTNSSEAIPGNTAETNIGGLAGKSWATARYSTYNGFNIDLYVM